MITRLFKEENELEIILNEVIDLKKQYRKIFPAMSDDKRIIKACKETAKKYKIYYYDLLKHFRPSLNIQGERGWNNQGILL
jgi:hypothetical protein